jgi:hypothetical protein
MKRRECQDGPETYMQQIWYLIPVTYSEERTGINVDGSLRKGNEQYSYEEYADMTQKIAGTVGK